MRPDIYFIIHDWMILNLKLRANELLIFSYIYAYSKYKSKGLSVNHISRVLNIPKRTVRECNRRLLDKELIVGELLKTNNFTNKWQIRISKEIMKDPNFFQGQKKNQLSQI